MDGFNYINSLILTGNRNKLIIETYMKIDEKFDYFSDVHFNTIGEISKDNMHFALHFLNEFNNIPLLIKRKFYRHNECVNKDKVLDEIVKINDKILKDLNKIGDFKCEITCEK